MPMNKYEKWLFTEIALWRDQGIIDQNQAQQIRALYQNQPEPAWGKVIFSAIGAVIFGLGIILLFAYNWEAMHRFVKLSIVLLSVGITHSLGYYFTAAHSTHKKIGESLHLLGTMLFGAGIWLVAQIYHIDEHFPNALLVWAIAALTLAWLLPSLAHTLLALVLIAAWHWFEVFDFDISNHFAVWLILLGIFPLAWRQRSPVTLFFTLVLFLFTYCASYIQLDENHEASIASLIFSLTCCYILCSQLALASQFPQASNPIRIVGVSVFSVVLYICSFSDVDDLYFKDNISLLTLSYFLLPILFAAASLWLLVTRFKHALNDRTDLIEISIVILVTIIALLTSIQTLALNSVSILLYNLLFLAYSMLLIYRGIRILRWQSTALGTLLLSAFVFARFMDLFDSLLMRGMAFIVIGTLLFGVGLYYSRQKQKVASEGYHHAE